MTLISDPQIQHRKKPKPSSSSSSSSPPSPPPPPPNFPFLVSSPLSIFSLFPIPSFQQLLLSTLSLGPTPRHVAFVMDGNRRWANSTNTSIKQGHLNGFQTLKNILEMCMNLKGLTTVSVYAFAIDNFRRNQNEVDGLMEIAKTRLLELAGHGEIVARYQVRIRIIGRKHLLPIDVLQAVEKVQEMTKSHTKATLNICMPYASRDEITSAARTCVDGKLKILETDFLSKSSSSSSSLQDPFDLDQFDFTIPPSKMSAAMQMAHSPPLDILVRTSGVSRLSDFMLWQCNQDTHLHFVDKFWPQFGLGDMVPIILEWQRDQWARSIRKRCGWDPDQ